MSAQIALNSNQLPATSSQDEDDLKVLGLRDSDLDRFAAYFELEFQGDGRSITVLVALLQRLRGVEKLRQEKQSGIWIDDIVGRLTQRLHGRCALGLNAASRFGSEASGLAEQIFSEVLPVMNEG
jgi:hypothetical protein